MYNYTLDSTPTNLYISVLTSLNYSNGGNNGFIKDIHEYFVNYCGGLGAAVDWRRIKL